MAAIDVLPPAPGAARIPSARAGAADRGAGHVATILPVAEIAAAVEALGGLGTPFQSARWLATWYRAHQGTGAEPLPILVRNVDGRPRAFFPLVRETRRGLRIIAFADNGITDYNAPVFAPEVTDGAEAEALWQAALAALPPADVLAFEKMPPSAGHVPNPLVALAGARASKFEGNIITLDDDFEPYHRGHERTFRKELERCWRVFTRHSGADLVRITDPAEAAQAMDALERIQRARIAELGLTYELDAPERAAHYRLLVAEGLADGSVVLTALKVGETFVAILLGVAQGSHYTMVRIAALGGEWRTCSPGRLVIERTMRALHAQGMRIFDFANGSYDYKRRMGVTALPLVESIRARSVRGWLALVPTRLKAAAKSSTTLTSLARRLKSAR